MYHRCYSEALLRFYARLSTESRIVADNLLEHMLKHVFTLAINILKKYFFQFNLR